MISLGEDRFVIEAHHELPDVNRATEVFLDVETKNNNSELGDEGGLYPYLGDQVASFAFTLDDDPRRYYVPLRHTRTPNKNLTQPTHWLRVALSKRWINHNIIFDATMLASDGVQFTGELVDTLTLSKIHDTDRIGHGLKDLGRDWLGNKRSDVDDVAAFLRGVKSKSYADVPIDILGRYACEDVGDNRRLYRFLQVKRPADLAGVWDTEIKLTPILFDMEYEGLCVDPQQLKTELRSSLVKLIEASGELEELIGYEFTNSNACILDALVVQNGLPILMTKKERDERGQEYDTGRPTFDKNALALYKVHPTVTSSPKLTRLVELISLYRKESQFKSLFLESFLQLKDPMNRVHPRYNQLVRTARLSCSRPNAQQQNARSKALIHPREGHAFMSCDYSQIEYRIIAHYIQDQELIKAYRENPDIDFHQWIADILHVKRKAGKTLNFGMAYGSGRKKVTAGLVSNPDIIEEIGATVNALVEKGEIAPEMRSALFTRLCSDRASQVYDLYHERFPGIKATAKRAADVCRSRGFVFNLYGRRRHLPAKASHKAFNTIVQSSAGDLMKERMVAISPRYNSTSRKYGLRLSWNVHDDLGIEALKEAVRDPEVQSFVRSTLSSPSIALSVPISTSLGISATSWAEAASEDPTKDEEGLDWGAVE